MSTRIIQWRQLVEDADPFWLRDALNPITYTFSNGRIFTAPVPLYGSVSSGTLPPAGLENDGGVLILTGDTTLWPKSASGLAPGHLFYDNGNIVCIAPGAVPPPQAQPLFFGSITSDTLLQSSGALLPTSDPGVVNQLWNNGNVCCVSTGQVTPAPPPDGAIGSFVIGQSKIGG